MLPAADDLEGALEGASKGEGAALIMMADNMDLDSKNTSAGGATCPAAASTAAEAEAAAAAAAMEVAALPEEDEVQFRTMQLSPIYGAQATNSAGSNGQVSEEPATCEPGKGSAIEETQQGATEGSARVWFEKMASKVSETLRATNFKAPDATAAGVGGISAAPMVAEQGSAQPMASIGPPEEQEHIQQPNTHLEAEAGVIKSRSREAGMAEEERQGAEEHMQPAAKQPSHGPSPHAADNIEISQRVSGGRPRRVIPAEADPAAGEDAHEPVWQFTASDGEHEEVSRPQCMAGCTEGDVLQRRLNISRSRVDPGSGAGGNAGGSGESPPVQLGEPNEVLPASMAVPAQQEASAHRALQQIVCRTSAPLLEICAAYHQDALCILEVVRARTAVRDVEVEIAEEIARNGHRDSAALIALQRCRMLNERRVAEWSAALMFPLPQCGQGHWAPRQRGDIAGEGVLQ